MHSHKLANTGNVLLRSGIEWLIGHFRRPPWRKWVCFFGLSFRSLSSSNSFRFTSLLRAAVLFERRGHKKWDQGVIPEEGKCFIFLCLFLYVWGEKGSLIFRLFLPFWRRPGSFDRISPVNGQLIFFLENNGYLLFRYDTRCLCVTEQKNCFLEMIILSYFLYSEEEKKPS